MSFKKKFLKRNYFILLLFIIVSFFSTHLSYSQGEPGIEVELDEEDLKLINYTEKLYTNYANQNFTYVYRLLHPAIKDILSEREYVDFQKENFYKYKLKFSNIKAKENLKMIELPDKYHDIIPDGDKRIYSVPVSYQMDLTFAGDEQKKQVDNQVYILVDNQKLYFLWNPYIIKEVEEIE